MSSTTSLPTVRKIDFQKVRVFLESVYRNSSNSKAAYETGLKHFQRFLGASSSNNNYQNYNVENILSALQTGSVNVYELLDGFVSYFVVHLSREQHIASTLIFSYVYAVRSYLLYHDIDINPAP